MAKLFPKLKPARKVSDSRKMPEQPNSMPINPSFKNGPEMKLERVAHKVMGPGYKHTGGTHGSNNC